MLDHEVLQVWMWDIYLIGAHLFHWDTPGRFTEWAWNTSNTPSWKGDAEGVDVILEVKRVWMCWSILHAFGFPKFSVCVVFVNNMLACFLYRWTTLLNLRTTKIMCWGEEVLGILSGGKQHVDEHACDCLTLSVRKLSWPYTQCFLLHIAAEPFNGSADIAAAASTAAVTAFLEHIITEAVYGQESFRTH